MKIAHILLIFFFGFDPAFAAQTILEETFEAKPDATKWKVIGEVVVNGQLELRASGHEDSFANSGINTMPMVELNFMQKPLEIHFSSIKLGGSAAREKQAFIAILGSDNNSETNTTNHIRLCINGDGKVILSVGMGVVGVAQTKSLVDRPITLPVNDVVLGLSAQGYSLVITDSIGEKKFSGEWSDKIDNKAWENSSPILTIKAVRRPGSGSVEASLGKLSVVSP